MQFQTNVLDHGFWVRPTEHVALAFHVDDMLIVGTRRSIKDVLVVLSHDLDIVSNEVTDVREVSGSNVGDKKRVDTVSDLDSHVSSEDAG